MEEERPHILVVDDDARLAELLRRFLTENNFRVTTAASADEARTRLAGLTFDLIVMDVMMPGESGLDLTESIRPHDNVPILMLTAISELEDRIAGLERGADDYVGKLFEPRELVARIRSILRRAPPPKPEQPVKLRLGECMFDLEREELHGPHGPVRLTTAEARLLRVLATNPGVAMSREELSRQSRFSGHIRAIDVQVARLRRKIEPDPRMPRYLQTIRGQGYVLRPE